jgi:hypothetical protein
VDAGLGANPQLGSLPCFVALVIVVLDRKWPRYLWYASNFAFQISPSLHNQPRGPFAEFWVRTLNGGMQGSI